MWPGPSSYPPQSSEQNLQHHALPRQGGRQTLHGSLGRAVGLGVGVLRGGGGIRRLRGVGLGVGRGVGGGGRTHTGRFPKSNSLPQEAPKGARHMQ